MGSILPRPLFEPGMNPPKVRLVADWRPSVSIGIALLLGSALPLGVGILFGVEENTV